MSLSRYLAALRQEIERLDTFGFAESIDFHEELRAGKQAIVKAEIVLVDGSVLFIREYIDAKYKIEKVSYAYQYQDGEGKLIFRYDNATHKPGLGFIEHKHTADGVITPATPPELSELIEDIIMAIRNNFL
jgi:hypothetical protein